MKNVDIEKINSGGELAACLGFIPMGRISPPLLLINNQVEI